MREAGAGEPCRWPGKIVRARRLGEITVPTLLVCGDQDVRAPLSVAEDLHASISGSRLVVLPGTGHVCCVEAPEQFNSAVRSFLHDIKQ